MAQYLARLNRFTLPMPLNAIQVNEYPELLERCIQSKSLRDCKLIHGHLLKYNSYYGNVSSFLFEKLTRLYLICGQLDVARYVFDDIPKPTVILWNMMIRAYAWNGPFESSINLYSRMILSGTLPNKFTFPFVLKACSCLGAIECGQMIHKHVVQLGFASDVYVSTALIDLYAKCGDMTRAEKVFYGMKCRDIVAWNAMITGFAVHWFYDDIIRFGYYKILVLLNSEVYNIPLLQCH